MQIRTGLNPYGVAYTMGLQGRGTPRENPAARGLDGLIDLTIELGGSVVELPELWIGQLADGELKALRARLDKGSLMPVLSTGLQHADLEFLVRATKALGADLVRVALTPILCGDRAAAGSRWDDLVTSVREGLGAWAPVAERNGLTIAIENHQDFTSSELAGFCERLGPSVRIVYDTGNSFPVAEAPLEFTRAVAPYVRYVHLKDYRVQFTDEGIRLVRCVIGDGAVPFAKLFDMLADHHRDMVCVLEPGALEARHVRLLTPEWWHGYPPAQASALAACLAAARKNGIADDAEWRTPWERGEDGEIEGYEMATIRRSAENMRRLGLM